MLIKITCKSQTRREAGTESHGSQRERLPGCLGKGTRFCYFRGNHNS